MFADCSPIFSIYRGGTSKLMRCAEASGLMEGAGRADALGIVGMAAGATVATWAESLALLMSSTTT